MDKVEKANSQYVYVYVRNAGIKNLIISFPKQGHGTEYEMFSVLSAHIVAFWVMISCCLLGEINVS
jgi:hypothetical protein